MPITGLSSENSAKRRSRVIATITTARTSGPTVEAMLKCAGGGSPGSDGTSSAPGGAGPERRGGRLNATEPDGPMWRRRSSPSGRSSSPPERTTNATAPSWTTLPRGASAVSCAATSMPSTSVPLAEPRSSTVPAPCSSSSSSQCAREIVSSSMTIVLVASRPIDQRPARTSTVRPASGPVRIASASGDRVRVPVPFGASSRTAPSCRPASSARAAEFTTRPSIATASGTSTPSAACSTSCRVASGLRRPTTSSRSVSCWRRTTCIGLGFPAMKGGGPAVDALNPGTVLDGRYRIEEEIARGGMGVIYRAIHVTLDLPRAVKLITPQFARDHRYLERFQVEATAAARIEHPNVVTVHDFGEVDGAPYLVMQYVEGVDLERLVEREGPLMPQRALALLAQIADGLDAAHAMGVVHRDVKPSNILVVGDRALLTDFGLAKQLSAAPRGHSELIGGTLEYAAPEQMEGKDVDARTDVYSLGSVFLYMLTGRTPGIGHLWGDQPAGDIPLPPAIEAVIARARSRDPQERYGSAGETARAAIEEARRLARATTRPATAPGPRTAASEEDRTVPMPAKRDDEPLAPAEPPTAHLAASETRLRPRPVRTPRHTIEDEPEPTRWDRWRPWVIGIVALLLLAVAGVGGAMLAGGGDKPKPTPDRHPVTHAVTDPDAEPGADRDAHGGPDRDADAGADGRGRRPRGAAGDPAALADDRERQLRRRVRPLRAESAERRRARALDPGAAARRADRLRPRGRPADHLGHHRDRPRRAAADQRDRQRLPPVVGHLRAAEDRRSVADLEGGPEEPQVLMPARHSFAPAPGQTVLASSRSRSRSGSVKGFRSPSPPSWLMNPVSGEAAA